MDNELKQTLEAMEARINARLDEVYERVERTETALLNSFRGWSTSMELRVKTLPLAEQRLAVLEDRVSEVERKLLESGRAQQ